MRIASCLATFSILLISCSKEPIPTVTQVPEEKTARFEIGRVSDYTHPNLSGIRVDVKLYLSFQDRETGAYTEIWDTTYAVRPAMDFPHASLPLVLQKTVINPRPINQSLKASYNLRFWKGDIIQYQSAALIPLNTGHTVHTIPVNL